MVRLTVTARLQLLLDDGVFEEIGPPELVSWVTAAGRIADRRVLVSAINPGPNPPEDLFQAQTKHLRLLELAERERCPVVVLLDQAQLTEQDAAQAPLLGPQAGCLLAHAQGMGRLYAVQARLSGLVPQLCVVFGPVSSALCFPVALCDAVVMLESASVCMGTPLIVKQLLGQSTTFSQLGGAKMHCENSGLADVMVYNEAEALLWVRRFLSYLPSRPRQQDLPPTTSLPFSVPENLDLQSLVPRDHNKPFPMKKLIETCADCDTFLELKAGYAREVITGFARFEGQVAGVAANNSGCRGGILFPETCRKLSRFISLCDAFGIPLVFLADTPGFMAGAAAEQNGIIRAAGLLFATLAHTTVSKLSVVVRKAHSAGLYAMAGPGFEPAQWLVCQEAAVSIFGSKAIARLAEAMDRPLMPETISQAEDPQWLKELGLVDELVPLNELRARITAFLSATGIEASAGKRHPVLCV